MFLKNIVKSTIILLLAFLALRFLSDYVIEEKSCLSHFYDNGTEKINLLQVRSIQPRVDYTITLSDDPLDDMGKSYSTVMNTDEIQKITGFIKKAKESRFYRIKIDAYMMFDDKRIGLYSSKEYIKKPDTYRVSRYMLDVLQGYGLDSYQLANLEKLKDESYTNKTAFLNKVLQYGELSKNSWTEENIPLLGLGNKGIEFMRNIDANQSESLIRESDIEEIKASLEASLNRYIEIR